MIPKHIDAEDWVLLATVLGAIGVRMISIASWTELLTPNTIGSLLVEISIILRFLLKPTETENGQN